MSAQAQDILNAAYARGYAKLSKRDLLVATIAAEVLSGDAAEMLATAISSNYLSLTEYDVAECIAQVTCSSPDTDNAGAAALLQLAFQNRLSSMSRMDLDSTALAILYRQTNLPCSTPTTPQVTSVTPSPTNPSGSLRVRWKQPANSGSLIIGWIVYWGTTSGVYTNNSGLRTPSSGGTYQINGLSSGTTYFVVVKAVTAISGCTSANSSEKSGTTTGGTPLDPAVTDWESRVLANGGADPSAATLSALNTFWTGVKSDGLDTKVLYLNFIAPDSLIAALTPFIVGGGSDPWQNVGPFVAGDLTVNGLTGDAVGKRLGTGILPSATYPSNQNEGFIIYAYTASATGISGGSSKTGFSWNEIAAKFTDNTTYDRNGGIGALINVAFPGNGWFSSQRTSNVSHNLYFASSITPHGSIGSEAIDTSGTALNNQFTHQIFAFDNNGVISNFCSDTISGVIGTTGLTLAEDLKLFNRYQTLRTTLGGGFR